MRGVCVVTKRLKEKILGKKQFIRVQRTKLALKHKWQEAGHEDGEAEHFLGAFI